VRAGGLSENGRALFACQSLPQLRHLPTAPATEKALCRPSLYERYCVLIGVVLNAAVGWWWADPAAAFVIAYYGVREGWHALHETTV
jgi:hypothetical protein